MRPRRFIALISGLALTVPIALLSVPSPANADVAAAPAAPAAAAAAPAADRMPGDVPSRKSAWVNDGEVTKIVQVGNTMIAGGLFTSVSDPMNGPTYTRQNLVAFDATTGLVSQTFNPTVDGQVQQLLPGPTNDTVYVAGDFTKINNKGPNHVQLLNINTGQAVTSFKAPSTSGGIETMELLPNNRLFIGGFFKKIAGVDHGQFAALNATTGALTNYMDITVAGNHNTGTGAKAPIGPREAGLTPNGDRMVVVGNFRTANGLARDQILMINLGADSATIATDWYTTGYTPICSPGAFDSYMRDVEMSPDGSFFVVATTGGPHSGTLCDTAARFETYAVGTNLTPTWSDTSGGDTLWGVEVTQAAVYLGGHNRWMNNPSGSDRAAQGAVPRPGLAALDPQTGVPLKWNPGRNPRGEAAYEIYETDAGVWVVSDTNFIGDNKYERHRIAFFPYDEGYNTASKKAGSLPGNIYIGAPLSASNVLYRINAGGAAIAATDNGPDWQIDSGTTSTFRNTGSSVSSQSALTAANLVNVPASTPLGIWTSERNDSTTAPEMLWNFPVAAGTNTEVRLYFASRSSSTRRFNVNIDGVAKLTNYDPNVDPGVNKGIMKSFDITSDGVVNIDFLHVTGNPEINAIEILNKSVGSNSNAANVVNYDGTSIASQGVVSTGTFDWTNVRGAVMVGRSLYYGMTDNLLYKRSFDGVNFGEPVLVDPYRDPAWSAVLTGSGAQGSTYNGVLPTWYSQLSGVTGMFYANGKIYYTRSGQTSLFWKWFSPDSGAVYPTDNTVAGGNIAWASTKGMFLDGNTLYVVSSTNGQLLKIPFVNGAPSGTSTVADSTIDWRGKALFLASVLPNVPPSAAFTSDCTGISCDFDASSSTDTDGTVQSYEWSFSDGEQAGGPNPTKEFAATGTYDVTLTVTDDGGLTSTTTQQVSVEKPNVPPTAAFTTDCDYLDCTFTDASTDSDGTVDALAWDFGDGDTDTGSTPNHVYDAPGTYTVSLTATDDDDATDDVSTSVVVVAAPAASTVSYKGGAVSQGNVVGANVTTPTTVAAGDRLLMVLSVNAADRTMSAPTGVTGWTVLDTATSGSMQTRVYTKVATAADANKKVTVTLNLAAKYTMTVGVYSGVRSGSTVYADFAENVSRAGHPSPTVDAPAGAWVVSYWADKSATTTGFSVPASVTERQELCGTGAGHVCSTLADSNGAAPAGQYGGLIGTANSANATATAWSIVLRTQEANQAPTSSFSYTCDGADCDFNGGGSSDPDGSIASYAWDFGDGATATGSTPSHDFGTSGTRTVTLTVTDDEGTTGTSSQDVTVVRNNAKPTASFTSNCDYLNCSFDAGASADTDGTVDSYSWDFGDGETGTGVTPPHTYAAGGPYTVTLTVTDNDNGTGTTTRSFTTVAVKPITLVGTSSFQGNSNSPNTTVPAATTAGDRMFMILTTNSVRTMSTPTIVTGWTLVDTQTSGNSVMTAVYTKLAAAADGGKIARVPIDAAAKFTMTISVYEGDMIGAPIVTSAVETVNRAAHTAPDATVADGDWVLTYIGEKSAATTGFTLPNRVTQREQVCGTGAGHVCSNLSDSNGGVTGPTYTGVTATADTSQATATMWTIRLRQDS